MERDIGEVVRLLRLYITLQMLNRFQMRANGFGYQVVDRNDAAHFIVQKNGQVTDVVLAHDVHAGFNRTFGGDARQAGAHDLSHMCFA